ncbi:hypothetical protein CEP54_005698 [Fusarium duplospermum]|uniref:Uncharacterized protein n=1 Tax=Fusarium duplospermum TaxID=1325734 RepID=A0A428QB06_9HYPO|nr:hypothetical protein CEP54_005698 [Fusarium duplospermum]
MRSIVEGPQPTDRLHADCSTEIRIEHPDGSGPVSRTAYVWRAVPYRVLDYDVMLPSNHKGFCESRDEEEQPPAQPVDIGGHHFATINHLEEFNWLLDGREHDDISNGGHCQLCFDLSMLREIIYPLYPP